MQIFLYLILVLAAVYIYNAIINRKPRLTEFFIDSPKIPQSLNASSFLVISDFHNSDYGKQLEELIEKTSPTGIFVTGDFVLFPHGDLSRLLSLIEKAKDKTRFYIITGNHEENNPHKDEIISRLKASGATLLENSSVTVSGENGGIKIIGISDLGCDSNQIPPEKLASIQNYVLSEKDGRLYGILLLHRANFYPLFGKLGVDLILSGHLHGGMLRLPFIGGVFGQKLRFFPKYTSGRYDDYPSTMIVSRGCDKNPIRMRLFNPPEILLIRFSSSNR